MNTVDELTKNGSLPKMSRSYSPACLVCLSWVPVPHPLLEGLGSEVVHSSHSLILGHPKEVETGEVGKIEDVQRDEIHWQQMQAKVWERERARPWSKLTSGPCPEAVSQSWRKEGITSFGRLWKEGAPTRQAKDQPYKVLIWDPNVEGSTGRATPWICELFWKTRR